MISGDDSSDDELIEDREDKSAGKHGVDMPYDSDEEMLYRDGIDLPSSGSTLDLGGSTGAACKGNCLGRSGSKDPQAEGEVKIEGKCGTAMVPAARKH